MRILYGVQGTGNGHIARARAMNEAFKKTGTDVDFLFSGRDADQYFSMEVFGQYQTYRGLTFISDKGKVSYSKTMLYNNVLRFVHDTKQLDLSSYDLVITDFEPVSAWAAKKGSIPSISISHQNAFRYDVPLKGASWLDKTIMEQFAPAQYYLGLHWYHFDQPILPPIVDSQSLPVNFHSFILVYLPFEPLNKVCELLKPFEEYDFICYHPDVKESTQVGNIQLRALCHHSFQSHLHNCMGVIANGGFELSSEALCLGKKLLLKPLLGQFEQQSNVATLEYLGLASAMDFLDPLSVRCWLYESRAERVVYPNVAEAICGWILQGEWQDTQQLCQSLWNRVDFPTYMSIS